MNLRAQLKDTNIKIIEIAPPTVSTDLHRERENPDDNKKHNNKAALSVEEFTEETIGKWKKGHEMIAAGPANKIVDTWEESMGPIFSDMTGLKLAPPYWK
jgi:short-subunit dehydrogenase involved in D-alanine esterification of teichoic acids